MRVLLLGVVLVAGCSASSTAPGDDVAVTATVAPATVRVSDTVTVRITVTNRGRRVRTIDIGTCTPPFVVTDRSDAVVGPPYAPVCAAALWTTELAPGEVFVFTLPWRAAVVPGVYAVRGRVPAQGRRVDGEPASVNVTP